MEFITVSIIIISFMVVLGFLYFKSDFRYVETEERKAGRRGEQFAALLIREVLNSDDVLRTNIKISYMGKETELDNVVVNHRGVFIIEVKNYSGNLAGEEDDFEWIQSKYSQGGTFYQKRVKNPIKQVKRQVYILSSLLKQSGIDVRIEGYVFLVERNSPIESEYVLQTQRDIDSVIHWQRNNHLTNSDKGKIVEYLSRLKEREVFR